MTALKDTPKGNKNNWYALKVFYNRVKPIIEQLNIDGFSSYIPMHLVENTNGGYTKKALIPSLLFIRVDEEYANFIQMKFDDCMMFYKKMDRKTRAIIPDEQMDNFILCTSIREQGRFELLGDDRQEYHLGEKVRVINGHFKGLEGYIKRIKKDRRLIVSIEGVVAVATEYIPRDFLEKIE